MRHVLGGIAVPKAPKHEGGSPESIPYGTVVHRGVLVGGAIADRILHSSGGMLVLENNREAYNAGDCMTFVAVDENDAKLPHGTDGKVYSVDYVYSGRGIEPGYVVVQFHEAPWADYGDPPLTRLVR